MRINDAGSKNHYFPYCFQYLYDIRLVWHLRFKDFSWGKNLGLFSVILISWGLAFFEYLFQAPANRIGFMENGGPYSRVRLKTIRKAITLTVFVAFTLIF